MRRILALSLAQPLAILGLAVACAIAGAIAFWHLPIEAFPELADPQVQVITLFEGHAAEELERQVTLPVDQQMNGLPGLVRMHSFSLFGLSFVALTFEDRKSTRLNSSHGYISYAVFCLKKKKK